MVVIDPHYYLEQKTTITIRGSVAFELSDHGNWAWLSIWGGAQSLALAIPGEEWEQLQDLEVGSLTACPGGEERSEVWLQKETLHQWCVFL